MTGMPQVRPIHEVFLPVAQDVAFLCRGRGLYRIGHIKHREPFKAYAYPQDDGSTRLLYMRELEHDGAVEMHVSAGDTANLCYGDEHIVRSENLPSVSEVVDARHHSEDVDVNFRDLFGKSESDSSTDSGGASVKVSIESEQDIEGFAKFKESVETEAHAEFSETEGSETSQEQEGEEGTVVDAGTRARIVETRQRSDGEVEITADGHFVVSRVSVGEHSGGKFVGGHNGHWHSLEDLLDAVTGEAPSNVHLADSFRSRPIGGPGTEAVARLRDFHAPLRYKAKFEGRIVKSYTVEDF